MTDWIAGEKVRKPLHFGKNISQRIEKLNLLVNYVLVFIFFFAEKGSFKN